MIMQNSMVELTSKVSPVAFKLKKDSGYGGVSSTQFKDVFNETVAKQRDSAADTNGLNSGAKEACVQDNAGKNPVKSYREAERNNSKENKTAKADTDTAGATKTDNSPEETSGEKGKANHNDGRVKAEAFLDALAGVLCMNSGDLEKVLKSLNIKAEDLEDSSKLSEVADRLAAAMGLSEGKKNVLNDILNQVKTQVNLHFAQTGIIKQEDQTGRTVKEQLEGEKDWVKVENVDVKIIKTGEAPVSLQELLSQLNERLGELEDEALQNRQELLEKILDKAAKELKRYELPTNAQNLSSDAGKDKIQGNTAVQEPSDALNAVKAVDGKGQENVQPHKDTSRERDSGSEDSQDNPPGEIKPSSPQRVQTSKELAEDRTSLQAGNALSSPVQNDDAVYEPSKLQKIPQLTKDDILSQVIDKAKVVIGREKAEMVMDLKPDYLGKLSLKVVTEHGIVMAKFVAESQQVKEILEANMQLLKDTLEKQGLSVQGFSVSVGQDSGRQFNQNRDVDEPGNRRILRVGSAAAGIYSLKEASDIGEKVNPYSWNDNKINLTA
ncbi:MAG: flagellar hook-length control protein FliK [Clostridiales bacterium]|jgi:flagellar hook-length control protein FliK|nr:flagellar hook-length control protein FliK [Eubacteriales bacterium]MDH7565003.1 flagellar hook-length control protein FliK [Clostridiales bacterium]